MNDADESTLSLLDRDELAVDNDEFARHFGSMDFQPP
jgi:hypothetical protein